MGAFDDIITSVRSGASAVTEKFQQIAQGAGPFAQPVAMTRITRTPIYAAGPNYPANRGGEYNTGAKAITIPDRYLQTEARWAIPHESAHAIFDKANLYGSSAQLLQGMQPDYDAMGQLRAYPDLYGSKPDAETIANEGLAFSVGSLSGLPFVNYMAGQIKDPGLARQLQRLNSNAVLTRFPPSAMISPEADATVRKSGIIPLVPMQPRKPLMPGVDY